MDGFTVVILLMGVFLVIALLQAGPGMRDRIAHAGLAMTGVISLVCAVLTLSFPSGSGVVPPTGWCLLAAVAAFGALAALTIFRPQR